MELSEGLWMKTMEKAEKVCLSAARRWRVDETDLIDEAIQLIIDLWPKYNESRGNWFTYYTFCLRNRLKDWMHRRVHIMKEVPLLEYHSTCGNVFTDLSEDAKTIISLLRDLPSELTRLYRMRTRSAKRETLIKYLLGRGWTVERCEKTFQELEE